MRNIVILGSTGSIGTQALDVIRAFPQDFSLQGISAYSNLTTLIDQVNEFKPPFVCVSTPDQQQQLLQYIDYKPTIFVGEPGLVELATVSMDVLLVAIVGTAALAPVVAALSVVSHIAIANKEVLVSAGQIIMELVQKHNTTLIPVDSEHSALFQCLAAVDHQLDHVKKLTLTASGGPFLNRDPNTFDHILPKDALKHPNWDMGAKITIDSATMANKGLEVIEAHYLFGTPYDDIDVVVHPKSIVHSFVETIDGAIFAHLGQPDMRYPIQYAMTYPNRFHTPWQQASICDLTGLEFLTPNHEVFPMLDLAYQCGRNGGVAPLVFNAANESAVASFLNGSIGYLDIFNTVNHTLSQFLSESVMSIDDIIELDRRVKQSVFVS